MPTHQRRTRRIVIIVTLNRIQAHRALVLLLLLLLLHLSTHPAHGHGRHIWRISIFFLSFMIPLAFRLLSLFSARRFRL